MTFSRTKLNRMTFIRMRLDIMTLNSMPFNKITFIRMALSRISIQQKNTAYNIKGFSIMTLSE